MLSALIAPVLFYDSHAAEACIPLVTYIVYMCSTVQPRFGGVRSLGLGRRLAAFGRRGLLAAGLGCGSREACGTYGRRDEEFV